MGERALDDGWLAHSRPSCAVNRNGNRGTPRVVGVRPDRVDHEAEFVSAVHLAHFGIGHFGPDELGVGEVREPVHTPRVVVLHARHRIRRALRPREQEWLAQAFDLNARTGRSARNNIESLVEWVGGPERSLLPSGLCDGRTSSPLAPPFSRPPIRGIVLRSTCRGEMKKVRRKSARESVTMSISTMGQYGPSSHGNRGIDSPLGNVESASCRPDCCGSCSNPPFSATCLWLYILNCALCTFG